jgi:hypothetical protein
MYNYLFINLGVAKNIGFIRKQVKKPDNLIFVFLLASKAR